MELLLAIILGTLFGFALNRVGATNPQNIINMLRLSDLSLAKVILFAIGFSSFLLFIGLSLGVFDVGHFSVKASYWGVVIGGALLGLGFAVAGYCPGTGMAAAATGRLDALIFVLGGLVGAFAFVLAYQGVEQTGIMDNIFGGKASLAEIGAEASTPLLTFAPGWVIASVLAVVLMGIAAILPK